MNNEDLSEMMKKAQEMINNNQVPPEIMQMANQIRNNNPESFNSNNSTANPTPSNSISNEDMNKVLSSLGPYLRNTSAPQPTNQSSSPLDQISNIAKIAEIIKLLK